MAPKFENTREAAQFDTLALMDYYAPLLGPVARLNGDNRAKRDRLKNILDNARRPPSGSRVTFDNLYMATYESKRRNVWNLCQQMENWQQKRQAHPDKFVWAVAGKGYALTETGPFAHLPAQMQTDVTTHIYDRINTIKAEAGDRHQTHREIFDALDFPIRYDYRTPRATSRLGNHPHPDYSSIEVHLPAEVDHYQFCNWYKKLLNSSNNPFVDVIPPAVRSRFLEPHQLRLLYDPAFELSAGEKKELGDQAIARYVHTDQFHPEEGRDLLFRYGIVPPLSTTKEQVSEDGRMLHVFDEKLVMNVFDEVFEFRNIGSEEDEEEDELEGEGRQWVNCKSKGGSLQFRLTEEGCRRAELYRQANPRSNQSNYEPPALAPSVNSNLTFIACHELSLQRFELLFLYDLQKTDPAAAQLINSSKAFQDFVDQHRSTLHSCSIQGCDMNELTLTQDGKPLSKGFQRDAVRSPYTDERDKYMCPMHFGVSYIHLRQGHDSKMNRRLIAFAHVNTTARSFSISARLGVFLRCPFGCEGLYGQANMQVSTGDNVAYGWIASCLECRSSQRRLSKLQTIAMADQATRLSNLPGGLDRSFITPYESLPFVDVRSVKCAVVGCVKLCVIPGQDRRSAYELLSPDGETVCRAHFIPDGERLQVEFRMNVLSPIQAATAARALVTDSSPLNLSNLARQYGTLPRLLVLSILNVENAGKMMNVEGWKKVREELEV
ncbi:hypothetical protein JCM5350_000090 [Sporobolomyces pararoseus]